MAVLIVDVSEFQGVPSDDDPYHTSMWEGPDEEILLKDILRQYAGTDAKITVRRRDGAVKAKVH